MGMRIDNAGRDDQSAGVDLLIGSGAFETADLGNPAAANAQIDTPPRQSRAVDDLAAAHDKIVVHAHFSQSARA